MVLITILSKNGDAQTVDFKDYDENMLYKKCSFRKATNFNKMHTWTAMNTAVSIFAKEVGKPKDINKSELPPPLDTVLLYGKIAVVANDKEGNLTDLPSEKWNELYSHLMGGFDDLDEEEETSDEESIDPENATNAGYEKDGFVVEDGEGEDASGTDSEESEWVYSDDDQLTEEEYEN